MKKIHYLLLYILIFLFLEEKIFSKEMISTSKKNKIYKIINEVEEKWLDQNGFLRLTPDNNQTKTLDNENPVLFTSEYLYLLWKLGMLDKDLKQKYLNKITKMIQTLRLEPGLFNRYPGQDAKAFERHFSRDEQIGLVTLDMIFDWKLGFAKELYEYGQKYQFKYQNRTWTSLGVHKRSTHGQHSTPFELYITSLRQPQFIEYLRCANKQNPTWLGQKCFRQALNITREKPINDTSGKILAFLRIEVMSDIDTQSDIAIQKFLWQMQQAYGKNPLHQIFKIYYHHPEHPCIRLSKFLQESYREVRNEDEPFIDFPLSLATEEIETFLNNSIPPKFERSGIKLNAKTDLQICVRPNSNISISTSNTEIRISIPLHFAIRIDWYTKAIFKIRHHETTQGSLTLFCKLNFGQDHAKIKPSFDFEWHEKPYVKVAHFKVRISSLIGEIIEKQLSKLCSKLEKIIEMKLLGEDA